MAVFDTLNTIRVPPIQKNNPYSFFLVMHAYSIILDSLPPPPMALKRSQEKIQIDDFYTAQHSRNCFKFISNYSHFISYHFQLEFFSLANILEYTFYVELEAVSQSHNNFTWKIAFTFIFLWFILI